MSPPTTALRFIPLFTSISIAFGAWAQSDTSRSFPPLPPPSRPPVEFFRELLQAPPTLRQSLLANKSVAARELIQKRIRDFEALSNAQQEETLWQLRLAQFRYYLSTLIQLSPERRDPLLISAPPEDQFLLRDRLRSWDALPDIARAQIIESDRTLHHFVREAGADPGRLSKALAGAPDSARPEIEAQFNRWSQLSDAERNARTTAFQQFFDLSSTERARAVRRLPEQDRIVMEKTLQRYASLPEAERLRCLQGFEKLASLSAPERDEFLRNATRWQAMTPDERTQWRRLVLGTPPPPQLPPLPPLPGSAKVTNR